MVLLGRSDDPRAPPVAIKWIDPADEKVVEQAQSIASVKQANVVEILDVRKEAEALALVMEYLEGQTAASLIERLRARDEPLDFHLAAYVIAEACAGVDAVHDRGILHERLTPHDVFITYDGRVKILDVGLDRKTDSKEIEPRELPYASPERCKGDELDWRSDVFSLAAILWELMTGVSPFAHAKVADTIRAIISGEPQVPPPKILSVLPTKLSEITLRALSGDRSARHISARAFRVDLLEFAGAQAPHHEGLRAVMQGAFGDRIKTAPHAAVVEIAPPPPSTPPPRGAESEPPVVVPRKSPLALVLVVAFLGVLAAGGYVITSRSQRQSDLPAKPAPQNAAPPSAASDEIPAPPAREETSRVQIDTVPPGATIVSNGVTLGTSPTEVHLPKGTEPVMLEIQRPGFQPLKERVVPDVDQRLRLTLIPARTQQAQPRAQPAPSPSANPYHRFD
jgi:serine/threonine-protein kinase